MKNFSEYLTEQIDSEEMNGLPSIDELDQDVYDDAELVDIMYELVTSLDPDTLDDGQSQMLQDIQDIVDSYDTDIEGGMNEAVQPLRKRINRSERRKRAQEYRRNKAKIKLNAKKYRRSAKYKALQKKAKRNAKLGKTATGKRKTHFTG